MENWPNLFIVGAPKAATTSLYAYLREKPGIYMSRVKEPHFFAPNIIHLDPMHKPIRDKSSYLKLFAGAKQGDIRGEASPGYLHDPDTPYSIHDVAPNARIIISLRNPIDLVFSFYLQQLRIVRRGSRRGSFVEEVKKRLDADTFGNSDPKVLRLELGLYFESVKRYIDIFGREKVKIIIFEEFQSNALETLRDIFRFLNLEISINAPSLTVYNKYGVARGPWVRFILGNRTITIAAEKLMKPQLRKWLKKKFFIKYVPKPQLDQKAAEMLIPFYAEDVTMLQGLLGRKLPWIHFESNEKSSDCKFRANPPSR